MALSAQRFIALWPKFARWPPGRVLFSRLAGALIPYTGSLGARVEKMGGGSSVVSLRARRRLRNHLGSIHAAALMNLAEFSSGLALMSLVPQSSRAILVRFEIRYLKKARGTLIATTSLAEAAPLEGERTVRVPVEVRDAVGSVVAQGEAEWLVRPVE